MINYVLAWPELLSCLSGLCNINYSLPWIPSGRAGTWLWQSAVTLLLLDFSFNQCPINLQSPECGHLCLMYLGSDLIKFQFTPSHGGFGCLGSCFSNTRGVGKCPHACHWLLWSSEEPQEEYLGNKQDKIFLQAFQGWFAAQHAVKALCLLVTAAKTPLLKRAWRRAAVLLDTSVMAAPSRTFPCKMSVCWFCINHIHVVW